MAEDRSPARLRIYVVLAVVALLALAAAWQWTPLREFAQPKLIARALRGVMDSPWLPVLILGVYVLSNAIMFPITVLCLATILALGTHPGFLYATVGSLAAALVTYAIGRRYGAGQVNKLGIRSLERLSEGLRKGGVVQVTILRLLPLAPFSIVNVMAGAARVRVVPCAIGTILGMLPGNLVFTAFGRQLRQLIANPSPTELAVLGVITVLASVGFWYLHRMTLPKGRDDHRARA